MRVKKLDKVGQEIFEKRYAYVGETTYQDRCRVMAHSIASAEKDEDKQRVEDIFYDILSLGDFVPGGRIIRGAGTKSQNMLNCFHKDTRVVTSKGIKKITDILIGDKVLTHKGRYREVTNKFSQGKRDTLLSFKVDGLNKSMNLQVTADHKIMTSDGYVKASDLSVGDKVSLGEFKDESLYGEGTELVFTKDYLSDNFTEDEGIINGYTAKVIGKKCKLEGKYNGNTGTLIQKWSGKYIPAIIRINYDFCLWSGYFLSEGCAPDSGNVVTFTFHSKEEQFITDVLLLGNRLFGIDGSAKESNQGNWTTVTFNSNALCEFHRAYFGTHATSKNVPEQLLKTTDGNLMGLLVGMLRGDAHIQKEGKFSHIRLILSNTGLTYQFYLIAKKLGFLCTYGINTNKKKESHSDQGELYIRNYRVDNSLLEEVTGESRGEFFGTIKSINEVCYGDEVWDISVKDDHSLVAEGVVVSNCYVLIPEDNVESIGKVIQDAYRISCAGGGIGFNFSKIRPKGDDIQHNKNSAPGSVSVMRMINEIGNHVRSGGNRRTALMGILNVTHPDILEFLHVKLTQGELTNFNISVAITNRFLEAVKNNEEWYFTFGNKKYYVYELNRTGQKDNLENMTVKVIALNEQDALERAHECHKLYYDDVFASPRKIDFKARDLWDMIWTNAVKSGDPGIYNIDLANEYTNVSYFERLDSTNPCGEISLPNYGNCCLGNVNLANMVVDGQFDWKRFGKAIRYGLQFLDNVLEINHFPIPECREAGHRSRRVGLGVMGYHYMLLKLGLKYGSEKCLEFTDRLAMAFRDMAYLKSIYLAREKGSFPAFNAKAYLQEGFSKSLPARIRMLIKEHGIRNAVMLTIPPTGTISMLMGVSSGIEPIFSPIYKRRWRDGNVWKEVVIVDPLLRQFYEDGLPIDIFVGAYDVTPKEHLAVQACWQRYIDSCISKTINLPADATPEQFNDLVLEHAEYLKGVTVYRASSKGGEPLEQIELTTENLEKYLKSDKVEDSVADGALCKINGECGA